ncbi:MAG: trypsin-like peptidase domain-containing protein [Saprospiraceae bacterium]|nr:trypsin-like peptidase domain-containing protein [Saprospiraceae bacterium]
MVLTIVLTSVISSIFCVGLFYLFIHHRIENQLASNRNNIVEVAKQKISWESELGELFHSTNPTAFTDAAEKGKLSVVYIKCLYKNQTESSVRSQNNGSGVLISDDGYIVTNYHVVEGAGKITITLSDKRVFEGVLVGSDENSDLALLKIEANQLPYLMMSNSDSLSIGEWVLAVGNPFNLQSTVTAGIVSAKTRNINMMEKNGVESFIQTDAAVNPGSSGGALINTKGHLVGINTAIVSEKGQYEGFSFAIPVNVVKKIVKDLKEYGVVQRGWLGVEFEDPDDITAKELNLDPIRGALISSVNKNGAAYLAGIKPMDVILEVDEKPVTNTAYFMELISLYRPGEKLTIKVWRKNQIISLMVVLKNHLNTYDPVAIYKTGIFEKLGIEVRNLDALERALFGNTGIFVVSIKKESILYNTKMEPGFIVKTMDGIKIKDVLQVQSLLEQKKAGKTVWEGIYKNFPGSYPYIFQVSGD